MPTTHITATATNRFLGRCENCIRPIAMEDADTFSDVKLINCPDCGTSRIRLERVYGTVERMACDSRCEGAVGSSCICSCGGRNHGGRYMVTGEALVSAITQYRQTTQRRQEGARRRAANRREANEARERNRMAAYREQNAGALARIEAYGGNNDFISSIRNQHLAGRELSVRQIETCLGAIERESEREIRLAQQRANATPAILGNGITVVGRIVTAKLVDGYRGPNEDMKMMVADDRGFKVWVSVPRNIYAEVDRLTSLVGRRVSFVANLERGWGDDVSLAKGKRPRNAQLLTEQTGDSSLAPA